MDTHAHNATRQGHQHTQPAPLLIRPYSTGELAAFYGVCPRTFNKWISPYPKIGKRKGRFYTSSQVQLIFKKIGTPSSVCET